MPWRWTKAARDGNSARTCAGGSAASIARPLAVRCAGSRTPTSVTSGGRPGGALLDRRRARRGRAARRGARCASSRSTSRASTGRAIRAQRLLAGVRRAELERGRRRARSGAPRAGGRRSPASAQHRQQVVDARARQAEVARDRGGGHRRRRGARAACRTRERLAGGRRRWPWSTVSDARHNRPPVRVPGRRRALEWMHELPRTIAAPSAAPPSSSGTGPLASPTSSPSPGTAPRVVLADGGAGRDRRTRAVDRGAGRRRASRTTASPPASARWPPGTSRPSCAPSCSAA